jgi:hypothetical protein
MRKWLLALICLLPALALAQGIGIGSPTSPTHTDPNYLMPAGKIPINPRHAGERPSRPCRP